MNAVSDKPLTGKEKRRERLRHEILQAASELFSEEGYESVTLRRIAEKIDYTQGAIYFYFKDKSEILTEICRETFSGLAARFDLLAKRHEDPIRRLEMCSRALIEFGREHPYHFRTVFAGPIRVGGQNMDRMMDQLGEEVWRWFEKLSCEAVDSGRVRMGGDPVMLGVAFWSSLIGTTLFLIKHEGSAWVKPRQVMDNSVRILMRGLLAPVEHRGE